MSEQSPQPSHTPSPASVDASAHRKPRRRPHGLWRLARVLVVTYLLLCAIMFFFQERFIFPGSFTQGTISAQFVPPPGIQLLTLQTPDGLSVAAMFASALSDDGSPHPHAVSQPTILFFYGNGAYLAASTYELDLFRRLGANVLIPEYLGYGLSEGKPGEAGCYATADAAMNHLLSRPDIDHARIIVAGWSLGAAVAVDTASRHPVAGLALFSPFTSLADMSRRFYPFLPASLILRHHFDNLGKMPRITSPVLIGHSLNDTMIPHTMADRLAAAAGGPVRQFSVEMGNHNDFFFEGHRQIVYELRAWLESLPMPPSAP